MSLVTECCGVPIAADHRFCPKCGWEARVRAGVTSPQPEKTDVDDYSGCENLRGILTLRHLQNINATRAKRWHPTGLTAWSALEWAGAMAGEAGEACNAAKKLKRIEDGIANINHEEGRSLIDTENACAAVADEVADTIIYGVLLAERVGIDIEEAVRLKFNKKSAEYGFPEHLAGVAPPHASHHPGAVRMAIQIEAVGELYHALARAGVKDPAAVLRRLDEWLDDNGELALARTRTGTPTESLTASDHDAIPPQHVIDLAAEASLFSPCRSKRGAVIFGTDGYIVANGYNYKPRGFDCDGSDACKRTCRDEAVHAEQQALLIAGVSARGRDILHVKTVDGRLVPSGPPSCVQCSKLALVSGIVGFWLFRGEDGWVRYPMAEFHRLSLSPPALARPRPRGDA